MKVQLFLNSLAIIKFDEFCAEQRDLCAALIGIDADEFVTLKYTFVSPSMELIVAQLEMYRDIANMREAGYNPKEVLRHFARAVVGSGENLELMTVDEQKRSALRSAARARFVQSMTCLHANFGEIAISFDADNSLCAELDEILERGEVVNQKRIIETEKRGSLNCFDRHEVIAASARVAMFRAMKKWREMDYTSEQVLALLLLRIMTDAQALVIATTDSKHTYAVVSYHVATREFDTLVNMSIS